MSSSEVDVERTDQDLYRIPGVTLEQVKRALLLLHEASVIQGQEADDRREALLRAMMISGMDPVPYATIAQARRLAEHRGELLASGAYTTDALTELRGATGASATRTWLARRREAQDLFTVTHEAQTLVPAFQVTADGRPRPAVRRVLEALSPARLGGWELWTWFTSSTSWLSGQRPVGLLGDEVERVVAAASRFAAQRVA